jgi:hypothetical protein
VNSQTYKRFGNTESVGIAMVRELDRLSPLKGVDRPKLRLIAARRGWARAGAGCHLLERQTFDNRRVVKG